MQIRLFILAVIVFALAACGSDDETVVPDDPLPTVADPAAALTGGPDILTATATGIVSPTVAASATSASTATPTEADAVSPTATFPPPPTVTPSPTVDLTARAQATGTAAILEAPVISTVTPGGSVGATPVAVADVVITEAQFQEEVSLRISQIDAIESARIFFIAGENSGIRVSLRALGGEALVSGTVFVPFEATGDFVTIGGTVTIDVGSGDPPQPYVDTILNDLLPIIVESFDAILTQRLGEDQNLESMRFVDDTMQIQLIVPAN